MDANKESSVLQNQGISRFSLEFMQFILIY